VKDARSFWKLLESSERRRFIVILVLILVSSSLELLAAALVVPAIRFLTGEDSNGVSLLGFEFVDRGSIALAGAALFLGLYSLKGLVAVLTTWIQRSFSAGIEARLSTKLFATYLDRPYDFFLRTNSAALIRNINNLAYIAAGVIDPTLVILTEGVVLIALLVLLFTIDAGILLVVAVIVGTSVWFFQRLTKPRMRAFADIRNQQESLRIQMIQECFDNVREIKLLQTTSFFQRAYFSMVTKQSKSIRNYYTLQGLPRLWLETLTFVALFAVVATSVLRGQPVDQLLPILGLFTAVAFRSMPSLNLVIMANQSLRYYRPLVASSLEELDDHLTTEDCNLTAADRDTHRSDFSSIVLRDLHFAYEDPNQPILRGVNLEILPGDKLLVVGESGGGKSTLLNLVLGFLEPTAGEVIVNSSAGRLRPSRMGGFFGYVPQQVLLFDTSIRSNIALGVERNKVDDSLIWEVLQVVQMHEFVSSLPSGLDTTVGELGGQLSGGQRQRLGVARSLLPKPSVLVLDEVTSGLDSETESAFLRDLMAALGDATVIAVSHRPETAHYFNRVVRVSDSGVSELAKN
jgi:ABC-type multidrug transport system fused ATPase/permease subunit